MKLSRTCPSSIGAPDVFLVKKAMTSLLRSGVNLDHDTSDRSRRFNPGCPSTLSRSKMTVIGMHE